jgi:predicted PurR-regulated permease PerM
MTNATDSTRSPLLWIAVAVALFLWALRDLALLVAYAVFVAHALLPVVTALERIPGPRGRHLPRNLAAALVMLMLATIVVWAVVFSAPRIATEAARFAASAPTAWSRILENLRAFAAARGLSGWLDPVVESARANASGLMREISGALAAAAGHFFSGIGHLLGFALLPLLAFYLLAERDAVRLSALSFVPDQARSDVGRLGAAVDRALSSYVRGQAIVCLTNGLVVGIALSWIHHPAALLLGVVVGAAELIPYAGFAVAAAAILLAGATVSPLQAALGLGVYVGFNWAIGTFVTPRVMGRYLKLHPFIVTVSVLAGAQLMGAPGALLALPGAAVLQSIIRELAPAPAAATPQ